MLEKTAEEINLLGSFCGPRDIDDLTQKALQEKEGIAQADAMVLFGGSIINGGDLFAQAIKNKIAKKYIIVGGAGHTTSGLRNKMAEFLPNFDLTNMTEAEIFNTYLKQKYNLQADYLETKSTNCGNNITYLLDLIKRNNLPCDNIILMQDATMQRRMAAALKKFAPQMKVINYAAYQAKVVVRDNQLEYATPILGMWSVKKYLNLLLGDITRLADNPAGYGPKGKNFITHVDIPDVVEKTANDLKQRYPELVRKANPKFA